MVRATNEPGERAGNCSLEEVVMAVKTRRYYFNLDLGSDTHHILAASRMVGQTTAFAVQPNKVVLGASIGNGPVDTSRKAIETYVKSGAKLVPYLATVISRSTQSQGEVTVRLLNSGRVVNDMGTGPDTVVASAKAYISALNEVPSKLDHVAAPG